MSTLYLLFNPLPHHYLKTLLQRLGPHASTAGGMGLLPGQRTRILPAEQCGKKIPHKTWSPKLNLYIRKYQYVRRQGRKSTKPAKQYLNTQGTLSPPLTTIRTERRPELQNSSISKKPNSEMTVVITCETGFLRRGKKKTLIPHILKAGRRAVLCLYFRCSVKS